MDSVVSEKALREVYLLPFEIAVEESNPWSIMAAYNDVNGVAATEQDHVNNEVVKGEWGWDGLLMSDWFATKTSAPAALGGLDLVMPGPDGPWGEALVADVESGAVPESVVDEHVCRLLRLAERVGALGGPGGHRQWPASSMAPDAPERRAQLRRLATDGMVVLANNGVLPLSSGGEGAEPTGSIALVGRHAVETICMGGGSAQVNPPHQVSIATGLGEVLGDRLTVVDGVEVRDRPVAADPRFVSDPETGEPGVRVTLLRRRRRADGAGAQQRHQRQRRLGRRAPSPDGQGHARGPRSRRRAHSARRSRRRRVADQRRRHRGGRHEVGGRGPRPRRVDAQAARLDRAGGARRRCPRRGNRHPRPFRAGAWT